MKRGSKHPNNIYILILYDYRFQIILNLLQIQNTYNVLRSLCLRSFEPVLHKHTFLCRNLDHTVSLVSKYTFRVKLNEKGG